jgi:hypothetical protein
MLPFFTPVTPVTAADVTNAMALDLGARKVSSALFAYINRSTLTTTLQMHSLLATAVHAGACSSVV